MVVWRTQLTAAGGIWKGSPVLAPQISPTLGACARERLTVGPRS